MRLSEQHRLDILSTIRSDLGWFRRLLILLSQLLLHAIIVKLIVLNASHTNKLVQILGLALFVEINKNTEIKL